MSKAKNSLMIINSASNHSKKERQSEDFYATPPRMVGELLDNLNIDLKVLFEPANGLGHVSDYIEGRCSNLTKIIRTDIIKRTENTEVFDFLDIDPASDNLPEALKKYRNKDDRNTFDVDIITNPPYFKGTEFLEKACSLVSDGHIVAFFVKIQYLETKKRYEIFKKYPPYKVLISVQRVHCGKDGEFDNETASGGAACYCWYIYKKGYIGEPKLGWINTGDTSEQSTTDAIIPLF